MTPTWQPYRASWWGTGLAFIGVELVALAVLAARRHPSFYDGTG